MKLVRYGYLNGISRHSRILMSFGPWYDDVYSSIEENIKSIRRLKAIPAKRWVVAHNTGLYEENPGVLWENYENIIYEYENKVLAFLERPKTIDEIAASWLIYSRPRESKEFFEFNERVFVGKHLDYLIPLLRDEHQFAAACCEVVDSNWVKLFRMAIPMEKFRR